MAVVPRVEPSAAPAEQLHDQAGAPPTIPPGLSPEHGSILNGGGDG
jgi:hypothetical protein